MLANLLSLQSTFIPTNFPTVTLSLSQTREGWTDKDKVSLSLEMNVEVFVFTWEPTDSRINILAHFNDEVDYADVAVPGPAERDSLLPPLLLLLPGLHPPSPRQTRQPTIKSFRNTLKVQQEF